MIPDLVRQPGVVAVHVGRHGPDAIGERLVASIWESQEAMLEVMGPDVEQSRFHPEHLSDTTDRSILVHRLAVAVRTDRADPERVIRVVRGRVRPGELDAYVEDARAGTLRDAASQQGPLALYLAPLAPDRVPDAFGVVRVVGDRGVDRGRDAGALGHPPRRTAGRGRRHALRERASLRLPDRVGKAPERRRRGDAAHSAATDAAQFHR